MNAVDTNILIYARDPRDAMKQAAATSLLTSLDDGVLLWQVACEYVAASRKLVPLGFDQKQAWADINNMLETWTTILPSWNMLTRAEELMSRYSFSSWDALIVAACLEGGVERLYSEDFDDSAAAAGIEVVNPFATA